MKDETRIDLTPFIGTYPTQQMKEVIKEIGLRIKYYETRLFVGAKEKVEKTLEFCAQKQIPATYSLNKGRHCITIQTLPMDTQSAREVRKFIASIKLKTGKDDKVK